MHRHRCHVADAGVAMLAVVPGEESLAAGAGVCEGRKACRQIELIFERLELRLGVGIIIADVGPTMALGNPELGEQHRHRLGAHRRLNVGVQRELSREDTFLVTGGGDKFVGEFGGLPECEHPADHVTAKDIEDDVEMEALLLSRSLELGDVPGPQLTRAGGEQLGFGVGRMRELFASSPRLA